MLIQKLENHNIVQPINTKRIAPKITPQKALLAMMFIPFATLAQGYNNNFQNNKTKSDIVSNKNLLQKNTFKKTTNDSTTINFDNAQKYIEEKCDTTSSNIKDTKILQDTAKDNTIKNEVYGALEEKNTKVAKILFNPNITKEIGLITKYGSNIPCLAVGIDAKLYTDKAEISGDVILAKNNINKVVSYGLAGKYFFDMTKGFYTYPKVSAQFVKMARKDATTSENVIAPTINIGAKYQKDFNCGISLIPCAEIGTSLILKQDENSTDYEKKYHCGNIDLDFLIELAMHYKNLAIFVNGGKNAALDYNIGGGINFKF